MNALVARVCRASMIAAPALAIAAIFLLACGGGDNSKARSKHDPPRCEIGLSTDSGGSTINSNRIEIRLPEGSEYVTLYAGTTTGRSWLEICLLADASIVRISDFDCRELSRQANSASGGRALDAVVSA
ncbi:MAG TPA: hypothetical protein VG845_11045, partial [Dehalococcoidia bacterium]|nr:hypothetical protein [Dehalococcoidia bacterium]